LEPTVTAGSGTGAVTVGSNIEGTKTHPAATQLLATADAGPHWTRLATLMRLFDGASTIEQAQRDTLVIAGIYSAIGLSRDGGKSGTPVTVR
jgi:hypothetical protein